MNEELLEAKWLKYTANGFEWLPDIYSILSNSKEGFRFLSWFVAFFLKTYLSVHKVEMLFSHQEERELALF